MRVYRSERGAAQKIGSRGGLKSGPRARVHARTVITSYNDQDFQFPSFPHSTFPSHVRRAAATYSVTSNYAIPLEIGALASPSRRVRESNFNWSNIYICSIRVLTGGSVDSPIKCFE